MAIVPGATKRLKHLWAPSDVAHGVDIQAEDVGATIWRGYSRAGGVHGHNGVNNI